MLTQVNLQPGKKKTAIVSYGLRITIGGANSRAVGVEYLRDYYLNILGREQVDIVTYKIKSEADIDFIKEIRETNLNDYDEVIIHQCVINVIGGVFKREAIDTFLALNDFKGDVWYFFGDPNLFPSDFSKFVAYKRYGAPFVKTTGGNVEITDEFCEQWSHNVFDRMKVLFAGMNYPLYVETYYKDDMKGKYAELGLKDIVRDGEWAYIPLYEYTNCAERLELKEQNYETPREYDLVYYGNHRAGKRNKIIASLYDHEEIKSYFVGYDPELKHGNYAWEQYVEHDKLFEKLASKAYATVVMGDELHNSNIRTPRFYESMHLDLVAFIWGEYDKDKQFIQNQELRDFIYVSSYNELKEKLEKIKTDVTFFRHIIELEREETRRDFEFAKTVYIK